MTGLDAAIVVLLKALVPFAGLSLAALFAAGDCKGALAALPGVLILAVLAYRTRHRAAWRQRERSR